MEGAGRAGRKEEEKEAREKSAGPVRARGGGSKGDEA